MPNIRAAILVTAIAAGLFPVAAGPSAADEVSWPKRIAPIARAVEDIRGLEFEHTVPVRFLSDADFERRLELGKDPSFQEQSAFDRTGRILVALGLVPADYDIAAAAQALTADSLGGYFDGRQVFVRGTELTPARRRTVAHELTHALQNQHFDPPRPADDLAARALLDLKEGEAEWVAEEYVAALPNAQREALEAKGAEARHDQEIGVLESETPEYLLIAGGAPYAFGEIFAASVVARHGTKGIDEVWAFPPTDDVSVFDLTRSPAATRLPIEFTDEMPGRSGTPFRLGAVDFYFLLAEHLGPVYALDIADTWEASTAELFQVGGLDCVRVGILAAGESKRPALLRGVDDWGTRAGALSVAGTPDGKTVIFTRCRDPFDKTVSNGPLVTAAKVLAFRNSIAAHGYAARLTKGEVKCVLDSYLVNEPELVELLRPRRYDEEPPDDAVIDAALETRRGTAQDACDVRLDPDGWGTADGLRATPRRS